MISSLAKRYLGLSARRVHQVLTGHLNGLFGFGKLSRIHQALLSSMAVRIRDTHQIGTLQERESEEFRRWFKI